MILTPEKIGVPIARALGVETRALVSLDLHIEVGKIPTLVTTEYATDGNGKVVRDLDLVLRSYRLILDGEPE